jgi:hypothetical protein
MIEGLLQPTHLVVILIVAFIIIVPFWRILAKAGYPGAISFLALIPFVSILMLFWLAFTEWPLERAAKQRGTPAANQ